MRSRAGASVRRRSRQKRGNPAILQVSGGSQRELGMDMRFRSRLAVRAPGTAGLGASPKGLVDDGLDGARAPAAFGAAPEAAIDLLGIARQIIRGADSTADIMVGEDVTGADDHQNGEPIRGARAHRYLRPRQDAKGKSVFSSDSKLIPDPDWNESKKPAWQRDNTFILVHSGAALIAAATAAIASSAITSTGIACTGIARTGIPGARGMIRYGMVAAAPAEMAAVAGTENARIVRSETIGRRAAISAAVFRLGCQHVANQRCPADCDCEYHHAVHHHFPGSKRQIAPACGPEEVAAPAAICDEMWQPCSLIIQAKCETFPATEYLSAVLAP
jgi:hypothetical protein